MAHSKKSIYSALVANLLIAIIKFFAGAFSNSASMISEGIHSLVDTVNQLLLLFGIHQSRKAPDAQRPFGYGKELYFWSFIVSIMIFGLGGGISIYQGYIHIRHPEPLGDPTWNYVVLGFSILFEGFSLVIAIREFNLTRGSLNWWKAVRKSKDPSNFLVLFEDGAAVLGLTIVGICMFLSHALDMPVLDGIASLLVGLLLVAVSLLLAIESRSLLMGEGLSPLTNEKIITAAEKDSAVLKVLYVFSTYQSPNDVLLMLIVAFNDDLDTEEINEAITRLRLNIKIEFKFVRFVVIQPEFYDTDTGYFA
jgi:cation diffusion facilitator family transporter